MVPAPALVRAGVVAGTTPGKGQSMITVFQTFETLGDPAESTHPTRGEAEAAAENLRGQIAGLVAGWQVPDEDPRGGIAAEADAWARARGAATFAGGCYGIAAGELIAREAVRVAGTEERWRVY